MYLLDTNVLSDGMKKIPDENVATWRRKHEGETFISAPSIEEMRIGQLMLPQGKRREALRAMIDEVLRLYAGSVLTYGEYDAERCAIFHEIALKSGRTPSLGDLMIAAIAYTHNMIIATRNVKDFEYLPVRVINPFKEEANE